jgi:hypothetical protein
MYLDDKGDPIEVPDALDAQGNPLPAAPRGPQPKWSEPGGDVVLDNIRGMAALPGKAWNYVKGHPVESAAMAGGLLAVPLTGGASLLPAAAAAGLGGAGGAGLAIAGRQLVTGTPEAGTDTARTMAAQGATQALAEGGGRLIVKGVRAFGPGLKTGAVSAYERMLKPNKSTVEGLSSKFGPDLQARSRNVAEALIADPAGQISKGGGARYADATNALQRQVNAVVDANPEARGSTQHLVEALGGGRGRFADQWAPQGDIAAFNAAAKDVLSNPRILKDKRAIVPDFMGTKTSSDVVGQELIPRVRANTARELTQGTYRNLGDKAYGELKGAATEAQKAAARGGRAILNEALPQVEPLNNEIARRIDLGQVLDEAVLRSGKHDTIGLRDMVAVAGGHAGLLPASLLNRPGIGSPLARGAYQFGNKLATHQQSDAVRMIRAALLAKLAGESK